MEIRLYQLFPLFLTPVRVKVGCEMFAVLLKTMSF